MAERDIGVDSRLRGKMETNTIVIGASAAGLAVSACLTQQNIPYILLEKEQQVATSWRNHYERLHLHTRHNIKSSKKAKSKIAKRSPF